MPQIGSSSYSESPVPSESYVSGETTITLQDHEAAADAHAGIIATHDADTSTHGVTTVAGLEETQTLSNKTLASPVITGTLSGSAITLTGNLTVGGTLGATSGTFSGTLGVTGNFAVNTNKFVVTAASGNTTVAGTLGVTGASTLAALSATTGTFSSTLAATGNFTVNTDKFVVNASSGNVGIGTTSPQSMLHLNGVRNTAILRLASTSNDSGWTNGDIVGAVEFYSSDVSAGGAGVAGAVRMINTNSTFGGAYALTFSAQSTSARDVEYMRIDSSGNVGIGTASPFDRLYVNTGTTGQTDVGYITVVSDYYDSGTGGGAGIRFSMDQTSAGNLTGRFSSVEGYFESGYGSDMGLLFRTADVSAGSPYIFERMRIDSSGNVGIGTTSPQNTLHLYRSGATSVNTQYTNGTTGATSSDGFFVGVNTAGDAIVWNAEATNLRFATSSSERMRIDSSGNVGIGTTSPASALHLYKSGADWVNLKIERSAANLSASVAYLAQSAASGTPDWYVGKDHRDTSDSDFRIWRYTGSHQTADFTINSSGSVGINDTTPSYKLDVNGTFRATGNAFANSDLTVGGSLSVNGGTGSTLSVVGSIQSTDTLSMIGGAMGTNARGTRLALNYNSDSGGGPGTARFQSADGNYNYVYSDNSDVLRIYATSNASYEMIASTLASGTVVGTQTSHSSYKYVLGEPDDIFATYRRIRSAANDVFDFTYKDGRFGRGVFQGIVIDRVPHYAMDPKPGFEDGDVLNEINLFGDIVRALADIDLRLNRIETGVPSEL